MVYVWSSDGLQIVYVACKSAVISNVHKKLQNGCDETKVEATCFFVNCSYIDTHMYRNVYILYQWHPKAITSVSYSVNVIKRFYWLFTIEPLLTHDLFWFLCCTQYFYCLLNCLRCTCVLSSCAAKR